MPIVKNRLPENEFYDIFTRALEVYKDLGYEVVEDEINLAWVNNDSIFGATQPTSEHSFNIAFNPYLTIKGLERVLFGVCLHELAHYIQFKKAFAEKLLIFKNGENHPSAGKDIQDEEFLYIVGSREDTGHSKYWLEIVDEINQMSTQLNLQFPISSHVLPDESKFFSEVNKDNYNFLVRCNKCGFEDKFLFWNEKLELIDKSRSSGMIRMFSHLMGLKCPECKEQDTLEVIDLHPKYDDGNWGED